MKISNYIYILIIVKNTFQYLLKTKKQFLLMHNNNKYYLSNVKIVTAQPSKQSKILS